MTRRVFPDPFSITPDEGRELMIYHLRMAACYFETTPDDTTETLKEFDRIILASNHTLTSAPAMRAFILALDEAYKKLED